MERKDIVKVLKAAKRGPHSGVKPDMIPAWEYGRLSAAIEYCVYSGFVQAIPVTNLQSPHPEYILQSITSKGEDYLESSRVLPRVFDSGRKWSASLIAIVAGIVAILGFLFKWWASILHLIDRL